MQKISRSLFILLLSISFISCASTRFESTWKNPDVTFGQLNGQKVATFLISENEGTRRAVEDALAREVSARGGQGLAGYRLMSTESAKDEKVAKKKLLEAGVEAVVTMQILSEDERTTTTPATWREVPRYRRFGNYWVRGWSTVYEPGYTHVDTIVNVETLIYEMGSEGLIWAGTSKTVNPKDVDTLVKDLASAIDGAIKRSGL